MLRYLNGGNRYFGSTPIEPHSRLNWEFYAVVKGACGVILGSGEKLEPQSTHLWVFPPHHCHGWCGNPDPSEVAVFHFGFVPAQLEEWVLERGSYERNLRSDECDQVAAMVRALQTDFQHPTALSDIRFHRALLDLTLLALADVPIRDISMVERRASEKVEVAVEWFRQHLGQNPGIEEVAKAVHVSTSHLRRLFAAAGQGSPHDRLNRVRIETAMRLMRQSDVKLDSIAADVGFTSASDFSRAFRARTGCSPREWRITNLPPYETTLDEGSLSDGAGMARAVH